MPSVAPPTNANPHAASSATSRPPTHTEDATQYLTQHRVPQILQMLASSVLFEQPDDPKEFMIRRLDDMRRAKARGQALVLFTRDNLVAVFRIFDVTGKGYITMEQYNNAMASIGATNPNQKPQGVDNNRIQVDTFVEEALRALIKA